MASLIYYRKEREDFGIAFTKKLTLKEAEIVYNKLLKHFKLQRVRLEWTSGRNHPCCSSWRICLNIDSNTFGVLCHEVAHLYQHQFPKYRGNGTWHNKKHRRVMKRMTAYCEKKSWFEEELKRRTDPKPEKPEPTKDELKLKEIARLENNWKRYQTKLKLYSNKLKKTQKRIERMKKEVILFLTYVL